jgi:hypothetical protein
VKRSLPALLFLCVLIPCRTHALEYALGQTTIAVSGYLEGRGVYALHADTPREDPSYKFSLSTKSELGKWGAFKLTVGGNEDGKVIDPHDGRLFTEYDKIYQDKNPSLTIDEAYVDIFTGKVDLRIGIQKFAWGRLDEINPTDNLNTEDITDPVLNDENERKIAAPAIKANIYSEIVNVEIGWIPRYVPYRLPTPEERWFPPDLKVPSSIETNTVIGTIPVEAEYDDIKLPPLTLANSEAGVRISKPVAGWELSTSYFTGFDPLPVFGIPTELIVELEDLISLKTDISAKVRVEPRLYRIHVFGLDFSTTYEGFTIRGEAAYFKGKHYFRKAETIYPEVASKEQQQIIMEEFLRELFASGKTRQSFPIDPPVELKKDALKYGIGLDYVRGDATLTVQFIQEYVLAYDDDKPIYYIKDGFDTNITMAYKHFFLQNTLELTLGGLYDIQFQHYLLQPSLAYNFTDAIRGTLGAAIFQGMYDDSLLGQFRNNDEVFFKLRYSF